MTGASRRTLLAAACLAVAWPVLGAATGPQRRPWPAGRATPPLALAALDGAVWDLAAQRGRVVALNFWASWCEPCRAELPSLELMAERHRHDGLVVVTVNFKESLPTVRRFADSVFLTLPVLRDADGGAARGFGVGLFPTTVFVGREGRIRFSVLGEADWGAAPARQWVAELLAR
jgi:thiol-disulfide isomerase/thioredoxin